MHRHLMQFLISTNQFYIKQGFKQGHSTTHTLLEIREKLRQACDAGRRYSCGVSFLDFQKVFDMVNPSIFLKKLQHCSIKGMTNKWFNSFFTDQIEF